MLPPVSSAVLSPVLCSALFCLYSPFILHGRAPAASSGPIPEPAHRHDSDLWLRRCALTGGGGGRRGNSHYIRNENHCGKLLFLLQELDLPAGSLHHHSAEPLPAGRIALFELQTVKIRVIFWCLLLLSLLLFSLSTQFLLH